MMEVVPQRAAMRGTYEDLDELAARFVDPVQAHLGALTAHRKWRGESWERAKVGGWVVSCGVGTGLLQGIEGLCIHVYGRVLGGVVVEGVNGLSGVRPRGFILFMGAGRVNWESVCVCGGGGDVVV